MAEKKKLSVAEILAAARKTDGGGTASESPASSAAENVADEAAVAAGGLPAVTEDVPKKKPAAEAMKPVSSGAKGSRPSVAEMVAMARAGKGPAAEESVATVKTDAPPAAAPEPTAKKKPASPPAAKVDGEPNGGPVEKNTASILAAARSAGRPGPMSKAEAARLKPPPAEASPADAPTAKPVKAKPPAPPMPAKPDYAKAKPAAADGSDRRAFFAAAMSVTVGSFLGVGFTSLAVTFALWTLGSARFMFPNILIEPPSKFKVGFPGDFPLGFVENKFKAQYGVWVARNEYNGQQQIYALSTICTHLGCTPNWLDGEQKFKCPCHGSGFYKDGINFEGPAPRPLERYAIRLADDGQIEVDKSKKFQEELGQWNDSSSFVTV